MDNPGAGAAWGHDRAGRRRFKGRRGQGRPEAVRRWWCRKMAYPALAVLLSGVTACTTSGDDVSPSENGAVNTAGLLQAVLDSPELAAYYHFDARPGRVPLPISLSGDIEAPAARLTAAGRPTTFETEAESIGNRRPLKIRGILIDPRFSQITISYAPEGIRGIAKLRREAGDWDLLSMELIER